MVDTKEEVGKKFPAVVARVVNPYRVVINRGIEQNIKLGQRFLVYSLSNEEILDPITQEALGYLEIVKGTGKVIHVQEKMSIIESDKTKISNRTITKFLGNTVEESPEQVPFESVQVGDRAKPI